MSLVKFFDDICSKHIAHTPIVVSPSLNVNLRIRPEQVTKQACIWDILWPMLLINHLKVVQIRTETSVHTENLVVDNSAYRDDVEAKSKLLPYLDIVPSFALIVEPIHSVDWLALVVSSQHEEVLWIFYFVSQQKADGFDTLLSSVDVVSNEKEFVILTRVSCHVEKPEKIEVLPMHITKNFDRSF